MNWLLLILAISLPAAPIRPEYYDSVSKLQAVIESAPCDYAGWTGPDNRIHICATAGINIGWIASHEMEHILAGHNLPRNLDWDAFTRKALAALWRDRYTVGQLKTAKYIAAYGGQELHAELPWITQGEIPCQLERWYPWFELDCAKAKGER